MATRNETFMLRKIGNIDWKGRLAQMTEGLENNPDFKN